MLKHYVTVQLVTGTSGRKQNKSSWMRGRPTLYNAHADEGAVHAPLSLLICSLLALWNVKPKLWKFNYRSALSLARCQPSLVLTAEFLALKQESRILGQWSNPVSGLRKCQASSPWAKQHRVFHHGETTYRVGWMSENPTLELLSKELWSHSPLAPNQISRGGEMPWMFGETNLALGPLCVKVNP